MSLPEFSTRYPVTVAMATLAVVLLGWISLGELGTDLLPDLSRPVVTVDLRAPGKSPREVEERYTRRLERDISTISGLDRVYSVTRSGQAVVVAQFSWEADMDFALLDVQKRTGPYATDEDVESVDVIQEDPQALPVLRLAVAGVAGDDIDALLGVVETVVKPKLEALAGLASAQIEGGAEREVRVTLDEYLLQAYGLAAETVAQRISAANQDVSGGTLRETRQSYQVKGLGRLRDIDDVRQLIVGERQGLAASGQADSTAPRVPLRVGDVARVELEYQERETIVRLDGIEAVGLALFKEADANTVALVRGALVGLEELQRDLPDVRFTVVENQARFIDSAIGEVEEAALVGALLAVGVLLLFLRNAQMTLVIGLAIPISILATFTLMFFQGLTLNIMTLGGLALGAGMLVDNAIVVIENIYRRMEGGDDVSTAAAKGASEVGVAILASTLTTVSVFLPVVYLQGLTGELFKEQAWTVAFALLSSLAVSMSTVPMLTARLLRPGAVAAKQRHRSYGRFLAGVLQRKGRFALLVLLLGGATLYVGGAIETEFIPKEDQGLLHVELALPEGTRLEATDRVAQRAAQIVRLVGGDEVDYIYLRSGLDPSRLANVGQPTGPNRATLSVALGQGPRRSAAELAAALDEPLGQLPELEVQYQLHDTALEGFLGEQAAPVQVEVIGDDLEVLGRLAATLAEQIEALPTVYNVGTSFQDGQPEIDLRLDEDVAAAFGITTQALVADLERRLAGEVAGELSKDQRSRTIRVGFDKVDLRGLAQVRVEGSDGAVLTLGDIAQLELVEGPREILRQDQRRLGRVTGYLADGAVLGPAVQQVADLVEQMELPYGYRLVIGGEERERAASFASLEFALILAVVLVYMVMASLFESLLHPFTVMFTVPLAGIGVVWAFWSLGEPLSMMGYIGLIMLGGIAVNDAIILVDRINQLRAGGLGVRQAVVQGAQDRLRPIMMTSATTILALLPMVVGLGEGARLRAPMAMAVIGGLVSSTAMTLVAIPVVYEAVERLRRGLRGGGRR
ncbi:MAG: AcrB/AcrD/AcrF family protein [Candidatus Latescibacteria bacterium]|nr:AcrB/AcrD/AcrF family protein [Candidatus Latescibacterota bacterium]